MSVRILGVGTAVPEGAVSQQDAAEIALETCRYEPHQAATLPALYAHTKIQTRYSVLVDSSSNGRPATQSFFPTATDDSDRGPTTAERMRRYEQEATDLAMRCARAALEAAHCPADQISHLVTVSCSGFSAPGFDIQLIERLALRRDVSRTHVGFMGCHGALNGLRVAAALARTDPGSKVLLCCVEICSIHLQYLNDFPHRVANSLFGDGAAAMVVAASPDAGDSWPLVDQRSYVVADTIDAISWRIGDHGFEMSLSARVPAIIRSVLRKWLAAWLAERDLRIEDVRSWVVHPGGPSILHACREALDLAPDALDDSYRVLADYGNMSSPTVLFILERARRVLVNLPCLMLAFGPGLTIEGALFC